MDDKHTDKIDEIIDALKSLRMAEAEFEGIWLKGKAEETNVNGSIWVDHDGYHSEIWALDWLSDYAPCCPSPEAKSGEEMSKRLHAADYDITEFWDASKGKPAA